MDKLADDRIAVRSIRLALRPALSLLMKSNPTGISLPNKASLDQYLLEAPGQEAAVSGFIRFLGERYQLRLVLRVDSKRVAEIRKKKIEAELLSMMKVGGEGEEFQRRWLSLALAYLYDLPLDVGKKTSAHNLVWTDGGISVQHNGFIYWVPSPIWQAPV